MISCFPVLTMLPRWRVWHDGNIVGHQPSYSTSSQVSTEMGDHFVSWVYSLGM